MKSIIKKEIIFISDLHLTEQESCKTNFFLDWLFIKVKEMDSLYILGDFFDYYLGDNCMTELNMIVAHALLELKNNGVKVYIMHGNRDFLIGQKFCEISGSVLIYDPFIFEEFNYKILLSHGDIFCIDDVVYMKYRKIIRHPFVIFCINQIIPNFLKKRLALKLRKKSVQSQVRRKFIDVSEKEIKKYSNNLDLLIHGHTHKQFFYTDKKPNRIVLGEWKKNSAHICILNENGYSLIEI